MEQISRLKNPVLEYEWGSFTDIPNLLGAKSPSKTPQAEMWLGAHPKAPSMVFVNGRWVSLEETIKKYPENVLGRQTSVMFGGKLPYLFKVLAVLKPLSIQAHPNLTQARQGFLRENKQNIPLNASNRNYKDDNHKPECICALTSFYALNGFRHIPTIIELLEKTCCKSLKDEYNILKYNQNPSGLKKFFSQLITMDKNRQKKVVYEAATNALTYLTDDNLFEWVVRLNNEYPGDIGVLSPLLLNLVCLEPGQAMFLPSGELHAYLSGMGIELMANSDNVLRGGLTPKHVDVHELLNTLNFMEKNVNILVPAVKRKHEMAYECGANEFILSVIHSVDGSEYVSPATRSAEIILCVEGSARIKGSCKHDSIFIQKGESVVIPAYVHQYTIKGGAILYKASVPVQ
jgi:mannose-6-phosphate isomerase